jgi:hypothetical protein
LTAASRGLSSQDVASFLMQHVQAPLGTRDARAFDSARKRIVAALAGRTVWCATAVRAGSAPARRLCEHLAWAGDDGVATAWLPLPEAPRDLAGNVRAGDIVVLHHPLTAEPAEAIRERGAHAVWQLIAPRERSPGVDAYVVTGRTADGAHVVAALMPSAGIVSAKQMRGPAYRDVGWSSLLADIVQTDREECVGGTLHARPAIAPR